MSFLLCAPHPFALDHQFLLKGIHLVKEYSKLETNAREIVGGHAHDEAMVLWL